MAALATLQTREAPNGWPKAIDDLRWFRNRTADATETEELVLRPIFAYVRNYSTLEKSDQEVTKGRNPPTASIETNAQ